jgi:hypothetical protein
MGTFCLSPTEWRAVGPKVGTAACLPSRSVEENFLNNTVDSGALAYTFSRAVRSLVPSYFQNTAILGARDGNLFQMITLIARSCL